MPDRLKLNIRTVVLMAKLESHTAVRRQLQRENVENLPTVLTIKRIYDKFLETGSVKDRDRSGRPTSATAEAITEISEVLETTPINSVRRVSQEVNLSKSVVHRTMRNILKCRPNKIHLAQKVYDEDQDLRVEMCDRLYQFLKMKIMMD